MATLAECEQEFLEVPEDRQYATWTEQVLEELSACDPPGNADKVTNEELNRLYNNQLEDCLFEPSYAAEWIHMEQFPDLYPDALKWRPELADQQKEHNGTL